MSLIDKQDKIENEILSGWRKSVNDWNNEKREFMALNAEQKAKRVLPFFEFTIERDFGMKPTEKQKDEFMARAIEFYKKPENQGRMLPDLDIIYKKNVSQTNVWTYRCIATDKREQRYFQ